MRKFARILCSFAFMTLLGSVSLTAHAASESEPNNTKGTATPVAIEESVTAVLDSDNDTDWYSFETTKKGYFSIGFITDKHVMESVDYYRGWDLEVYASDGQTKLYGMSKLRDSYPSEKLPYEPGKYYIKVSANYNIYSSYIDRIWGNYAPINVEYSVVVHECEASDWECESNNNRQTANPITAASHTIHATLGGDDNYGDWFSFELSTRSMVTLDFMYDGNVTVDKRGKGVYVEFYKDNETQPSRSAYRLIEDYTTSIAVPAGKYYVHVGASFTKSDSDRPQSGTEYAVSYSATPTTAYDEAERGTRMETTNTDGLMFYRDNGNVYCYDRDGTPVVNSFACDGIYTYFFQADRTAMKNRLTYHPDGVHVIYFDGYGHEVFSNFANVKKTVTGENVDDYCFFDVYGYLYVDVVTYDMSGKKLYYANEYGVMDRSKWFRFSDTAKWADGTPFDRAGGDYGYAQSDCSLMTNRYAYDWNGTRCYLQGNGVAKY